MELNNLLSFVPLKRKTVLLQLKAARGNNLTRNVLRKRKTKLSKNRRREGEAKLVSALALGFLCSFSVGNKKN